MATYYVISTTSSDDGNAAYRDKACAQHRFEDVAATGQFVRLIAFNGEESVELDYRNAPFRILASATPGGAAAPSAVAAVTAGPSSIMVRPDGKNSAERS